MMAANWLQDGLPTVQPVEVCEDVGLWNSYRQGTLLGYKGKQVAVLFEDGSHRMCATASLRPEPPSTSLHFTRAGQLLELQSGDLWRTVVCAQDAQLDDSKPQQLQVVIPGTMTVEYASSANLRLCQTYDPTNPQQPWQLGPQDIPSVQTQLEQNRIGLYLDLPPEQEPSLTTSHQGRDVIPNSNRHRSLAAAEEEAPADAPMPEGMEEDVIGGAATAQAQGVAGMKRGAGTPPAAPITKRPKPDNQLDQPPPESDKGPAAPSRSPSKPQQQQKQQQLEAPTKASFVPAAGATVKLFSLTHSCDFSRGMAFTVVQEVGSKAASVVLQVVKQLPAWVTTLSPTTFEAAGVSLPPAPSGWELGAAGLGLPPAVTYALPLGSGQTVARQYALKISQPWELSDSYQQDSSLEGREKYLQAVNRRMAQEERVIKRVHAAPNNHSSQHVIQCYGRGWVELPGCDYPLPALLLEYYPGGSLEDMGPLDADDAGWHLAQVAQGLMALQAAGIAHTNLHPSHCIIDELGDVNLCGFGCAEELGVGALTGFTPGPRLPGYTPAELAPDCKHDITVDVWALGGLLVRLRSGEDPEGLVEGQPDQLNGQKVYNLPSRYSQLLTEEEQSLVMDCLKPCYARPTATKLWDRHVGYFDRHY